MEAELEAIKDAWSKETGDGRDDEGTRRLCDLYVAAHPEHFDEYEGKTLDEVVAALEVFRDAGMEESQWRCEVYLLHHWEPQQIGGPVLAQIRIPSTGG